MDTTSGMFRAAVAVARIWYNPRVMKASVLLLALLPCVARGLHVEVPPMAPDGSPTTNSAYAWTEGDAYADNPFGWNVSGTEGDTPPYKRFGEDIKAIFRIDRHGRVGVFKLDNSVERKTNGVVRLFGPKEQKR